MNKTVLGIAVVLVIGVLVYFATANKKGSSTEENSTSNQESTSQSGPVAKKGSLKSLLGGGSQSCTYSDGQNQGTVYAANGKVRMDMTSMVNGVSMSSHGMMDNSTYYSWVDGQPNGFKFSVDSSATGTGSAGSNQNVDVNREMDYNCDSRWSVDSSKFNLPSNVEFMDMSSFKMPTGM